MTLTVSDVSSYEEYVKLINFLKKDVPCVREVSPSRFSWKEVSLQVTLRGPSGCMNEVRLPFDVQKMADNEITGVLNRQEKMTDFPARGRE